VVLPVNGVRGVQYDTRTDAVVYGCDATRDFTHEDWIRLAMAALDQAGLDAAEQAVVRHALGSRSGGHVDVAGITFGALRISNVDMACELAELTRTEQEAARTIAPRYIRCHDVGPAADSVGVHSVPARRVGPKRPTQ
jgi:hypothetical protein